MKYYEEMKYELQHVLPSARRFIYSGDTYPVPLPRMLLSTLTTITFVCTVFLYFWGRQMTFLPDSVRAYVASNGGSVLAGGVMLFMLGNALRQTGAFEVYVNETKIFSKLETGEVPSVDELLHRILQHTILRYEQQ